MEDLTKHKTDSEQMIVDEKAVSIVNHAKDENRQVCAVGTTVMRAIESTVSTDGHLKPYNGWTNKFIFPPYDFTVANAMVANFQMPLGPEGRLPLRHVWRRDAYNGQMKCLNEE